jgi:hypothetical protein
MQETGNPGIAYALDVVGWIVVVLSILAAAVAGIAVATTAEGATPMAWGTALGGAASGLLLIAIATIIRQLHGIAGSLDKVTRLQSAAESAAAKVGMESVESAARPLNKVPTSAATVTPDPSAHGAEMLPRLPFQGATGPQLDEEVWQNWLKGRKKRS